MASSQKLMSLSLESPVSQKQQEGPPPTIYPKPPAAPPSAAPQPVKSLPAEPSSQKSAELRPSTATQQPTTSPASSLSGTQKATGSSPTVPRRASASPPKLSPPPPPHAVPPKLGNNSDAFEQHGVHWSPHGDILLQVGRVRFRVSRGQLQDHSAWFRRAIQQIDCLDVACAHLRYSEAGSHVPAVLVKVANVDGVPLLYIDAAQTTDVPSASEFSLLLDVLYDGIQFVYTPLSFDKVVSLYKTATYYCFPHIITCMNMHMEAVFPSGFSSLDKQLVGDLPEVALAIGTKYGIDSIRRRAYYDLARAPASQWRLLSSTNLRVIVPVAGAHSRAQGNSVVLPAEPLTNTCIRRINTLREHLSSAWDKIHLDVRSLVCPSVDCGCLLKNRLMLLERATDVMFEHRYNPLHGVRILAEDDKLIRVICVGAQASVKAFVKNKEAFIIQALEREWNVLN